MYIFNCCLLILWPILKWLLLKNIFYFCLKSLNNIMLTSLCGDYLVFLNISFFFFNCFFISSWIAMFSHSGDFEVLFLLSFHCFCNFVIVCATVVLWKWIFIGFWWVFWQNLTPLLTNQLSPYKFRNPPHFQSQGQSDQVGFLHTKEKEIARIT